MSKKLIKYYKGIILPFIQLGLHDNGLEVSDSKIDTFLKHQTGIKKSCSDMTQDELLEHIELSIHWWHELTGEWIKYPSELTNK